MVDWSASQPAVQGPDSVWWSLQTWEDGELALKRVENPRTRGQAFLELRTELRRLSDDGASVLIGFDFPYGYPNGFAAALKLPRPTWRNVWTEIAERVVDQQAEGSNNRFHVAAGFNARVAASGGGPFWGCPQGMSLSHLPRTQPGYPVAGLQRLRVTDTRLRGPKPVWQLNGL